MKIPRAAHGFTLMELLVVISIIALLGALVMGGSSQGNSKRHATFGTLQAIQTVLDRYHAEYGEYPEPMNADETAEIMPGKVYQIGAAKCLYQVLSGDGRDAIQGNERFQADGKIGPDEVKNKLVQDLPTSIWRKVGDSYILIDAFGHPFQYIKADSEKKNTINSTYDLWSYADDVKNVMAKSKDAEANASLGAKWIKNW